MKTSRTTVLLALYSPESSSTLYSDYLLEDRAGRHGVGGRLLSPSLRSQDACVRS